MAGKCLFSSKNSKYEEKTDEIIEKWQENAFFHRKIRNMIKNTDTNYRKMAGKKFFSSKILKCGKKQMKSSKNGGKRKFFHRKIEKL
jgi:hypothetical protein